MAGLIFLEGVILSKAVLQAERRTSGTVARESYQIPRPAGENAGHRDDAPLEFRLKAILKKLLEKGNYAGGAAGAVAPA